MRGPDGMTNGVGPPPIGMYWLRSGSDGLHVQASIASMTTTNDSHQPLCASLMITIHLLVLVEFTR
jgi:hypothetical protein